MYEEDILRACAYAPFVERFWARVRKSDGCWEWTSGTRRGYGRILLPGWIRKRFMAHATHVAWTLEHGRIPDGMFLLHSCDNPLCVRHIFLGTQRDNVNDRDAKGRQARGVTHSSAKLSEADVREIRRRAKKGLYSAIAREYGVSSSTILRIVTREMWPHLQ